MGVPKENIIIGEIGRVIEITPEKIGFAGTVPAGSVMVDGLGVGDVGSIVLRDRKHLAEDGLIIVLSLIHICKGRQAAACFGTPAYHKAQSAGG